MATGITHYRFLPVALRWSGLGQLVHKFFRDRAYGLPAQRVVSTIYVDSSVHVVSPVAFHDSEATSEVFTWSNKRLVEKRQ